MIGQTVEKYRIRKEIGQGGMAVVYLARDLKLERDVAVKILHPHLTRQPEALKRFQREAVTVARLQHPNIIEIYDYSGDNSAQQFIATEYVDGETLGVFIERHKSFPCELVACIGRELCLALNHAHEEGVIHRDLKPENIMIRRDGKLKLMDFGIARALEVTSLTMTGSILGSPSFMSPEHLTGKAVDFRSDIFSLGGILYFMATGHLPFEGRNPHEVLKKVSEGDCPPVQQLNPTISNEFAGILQKAMEVDPTKRYQQTARLLADLDALIARSGIDHPEQEVHRLLSAPERYLDEFTARLTEKLRRDACRQMKKRPALAMQSFNRLLAFDPDDEESARMIEVLLARGRAQQRTRFALKIGVFGCLLAIAILLWLRFFNVPLPKPLAVLEYQSEPAMSFWEGPLQAEKPTTEKKKPQPSEIDPTPSMLRATPETGAKARPKFEVKRDLSKYRGSLKVVARPWADIFIDNRKVGTYPVDANKSFPVESGKHTVKLVNPGFEPHEETVEIDRPEKQIIIRKRLQLRPAKLRLNNNQDAMVFIDGEFKGRTPFSLPVEVRWSEQKSMKEVLVSVNKEGYDTFNRRIKMEAGKTASLDVVLSPKP